MIRFEKVPFSQKVKIRIESRSPFFSRELLIAFLGALLFHMALKGLFTLEKSVEPEGLLLPKGRLSLDLVSVPSTVKEKPSFIEKWGPPPALPLPPSFQGSLDEIDYISLTPKEIKLSSPLAFIRGPYPFEPLIPLVTSQKPEDYARLEIRSDAQGNLLWLKWEKKPEDLKLVSFLETWVKTVKFKNEAAFLPQNIEVYFP
jgi:hypothetical protein